MTSETRFSTSYASIWKEITPLSDGYWVLENLLARRIDEPIKGVAPKHLRGLVNELAFIAFASSENFKPSLTSIHETVHKKIDAAVNYINRVSSGEKLEVSDVDAVCLREAELLCKRLHDYFPIGVARVLRPKFKGCGFITSCEGDIITGDRLFEVKAGDRSFRISDLRQLLTYSALAYAAGELHFQNVGLFNPRTGMSWVKSLDDVCMAVGGGKANDVLPRIIDFMQTTPISR
jgi:hypothetical protein